MESESRSHVTRVRRGGESGPRATSGRSVPSSPVIKLSSITHIHIDDSSSKLAVGVTPSGLTSPPLDRNARKRQKDRERYAQMTDEKKEE
uniref:Uncharacterized protein n=1 Tax=Oryza sativa subsp. japonica TaxID=39947 RepID=Q5Z9C2_ORYSJ|nr:hypothetical protein [Oryza sativa Japonica Group]